MFHYGQFSSLSFHSIYYHKVNLIDATNHCNYNNASIFLLKRYYFVSLTCSFGQAVNHIPNLQVNQPYTWCFPYLKILCTIIYYAAHKLFRLLQHEECVHEMALILFLGATTTVYIVFLLHFDGGKSLPCGNDASREVKTNPKLRN